MAIPTCNARADVPSASTALLAILSGALLGGVLLSILARHWSHLPQYSFGYAVPFLCAYLAWLRLKPVKDPATDPVGRTSTNCARGTTAYPYWIVISSLVLAYFPVRLLEEANPDWRPLLWLHALIVIGLGLWLITSVGEWFCGARFEDGSGNGRLLHHPGNPPVRANPLVVKRRSEGWTAGLHEAREFLGKRIDWAAFSMGSLAFPFLFLLVAVPWPSAIEQPIIDALTRANSATTVEILGTLGIAAIQHGNLIEVGSGVVGIDEACSGIRSFQAMPMLSLFFGELYRLGAWPRIVLVLFGFTASFLFNLARTTVLTLVAARQGSEAIARWHDPAGTTILLACFISVWGLAVFLGRRRGNNAGRASGLQTETRIARIDTRNSPLQTPLACTRFCSIIAAWLLASELGVFAWYEVQEKRLPAPVTWSLSLPADAGGFSQKALPEKTRNLLRCDESWEAQWADANDLRWQVIFGQWHPGRAAGYLSLVHNPQVCLPASGFTIRSAEPVQFYHLGGGLNFPYRQYLVQKGGESLHVFFSVWDDRRFGEPFLNSQDGRLVWSRRLQAVWNGRGSSGQRLLEVALSGTVTAAEAEERFLALLRNHVRVSPL